MTGRYKRNDADVFDMGIKDQISELLGSGKKGDEDIQENIEKIREKVQSEERREMDEPEPPEPRGGRRERPREPRQPEEGPGRREAGVREQEEREQLQPRTEPREDTGSPDYADELPEPPEKKELDIPDIEKGPLFINVDKFREAVNTLSELRDLAADLGSDAGSLEGTLDEDRDIQESMEAALEEFERDSEQLQDIVSP